MAACKQYGGITRQEFTRLRADAEKEGLSFPPGDAGAVNFQGVSASFEYNERTLTLKLCIVKKPLLYPESIIWQAADSLVEPYVGT